MTSKKDLSRELCEICGIEAKQFTKDFKTREKAANFGRKITGIPKFRGNKFDIGSYTDNESIYQVHWKEYPDFTRPENFIKLLNFYYRFFQGVDICAFEDEVRELEARGEQISIQNDFLAMLIFDLQNREHGFNLDINFEVFTQAIREMEWVYE